MLLLVQGRGDMLMATAKILMLANPFSTSLESLEGFHELTTDDRNVDLDTGPDAKIVKKRGVYKRELRLY